MKKIRDELDIKCHGIHAECANRYIIVDMVYIVDDMISAISNHSEEIISSVSYSWYNIHNFYSLLFLFCSVIFVSLNSKYDF